MGSNETVAPGAQDRRWAGVFRPCASCGGRNWVGSRRCRHCDASLVGVRAVSRPRVAMVGRRSADQVLTPRTRAAALGALALALVAGAGLLYVFRADGFEAARPVAVTPSPASPVAAAGVAPSEAPEPDVTASLRAADRGRALLARGEVKAAVSLLAPAVRDLPADAELAHLYGTALWEFGARDLAVFQLQRAVRIAPQNEGYRSDLARALQATGRPAAAARLLYGEGPPPGTATGSMQGDATDGADLGGAGAGTFKGRRSFTDEDLRGRVPGPLPGNGPR